MIRLFISDIEYTDYLLSCSSSEKFEDGIIIGNTSSKQLNISLDNENKVFDDLLSNVLVIQENETLYGNFLVYNKPERMTATIDLTLYDSMALTNVQYDTKLDYVNTVVTIADQLEEISILTKVKIEFGDLPLSILNTQVFTYDNTVSCRAYLGWIGELGCCNAFSLPTGSIAFISLNITNRKTLSETDVEQFETIEQYTVSKVKFDNGSIVPIEKGNDEGKTIYISQDNIYLSVSDEERNNNIQNIVDYIYDKLNGLSFMIANNFKVVEIDNLTLGDLILYENEFTFMATQIDTTYYNAEYNIQYLYSKFPTDNKDKVTNHYDMKTRFRRLTSEFDQEKLKWSVTAKEVEDHNEKIGKLEVDVNGLSSTVSEVKEENNIITSNVTELNVKVDGLTNRITSTGGNNLILNSMGVYEDGWNGKWFIDKSQEIKKRNIYGFALNLANDTLKQSIQLPNGNYTLSFLYAKYIDLATVKLLINGEEFVLSNNELTNFKYSFEVTTGNIEIQFISDTDYACSIVNLMLNQGTDAMIWSLNSNESWSDTMKMSSSGLTIESSGADVLFNAKADIIGFMNKNTKEYVAIFTDVGATMNELVVKNKAKLVCLLFQEINGQTVVNRIAGDK